MAQASSPTAEADGSHAERPAKRRFKPKLAIALPLLLVLVGGAVGLRHWLTTPDDSAIALSGRIEGYETNLGAKVGGRIAEITVREGDAVQVGQVVARLDDAELQAQLAATEAQVAAARQQVNQAQLQVAVVESQIQEAQLTLQQSQGETAGRVSQSEASVAAAQAQLAEARARAQETLAALALAQGDRDRFATLAAQGAVPQQQLDQAQTQVETTQATLSARQSAVAAAQQQVSAAQGSLTQAQTTEFNPEIRTAQVQRLQTQQDQARAQLAGAEANLKQAQAAQAEAEARRDDLAIKSPIAGVVVTRTAEPGEVLAAGATVLTLVNLDQVYLRGYIPQGEVGRVRVGQTAHIFLDSAPDQPLAATVAAVDAEASFTPENIYFKDDRVTQVVGLKLALENPGGYAKPGMPADGEILLDEAEAAR
ncbi:MAG: HlyD family efflux transporter periplasmic adaptor subunit [Tildeniella torsiva UHER 1998/13D]|jgi:HlyD family secretion protein|nr:HlyD family efflux transporter periplasmic adaptor subunit [Tildeniella torsiva UHER 1998/13D]